MSGLSETERAGFTKILSLMTKCDLLSLSDTVTNKMIVVENITGKTFIQFHMAKRKSAYLKFLLPVSYIRDLLYTYQEITNKLHEKFQCFLTSAG